MENKIQIGDTVITRKFETNDLVTSWSYMDQFIGKEGIIKDIDERGNYLVHGFYWPPSAVEPVPPPFQPEYGEVIQCRSVESFDWLTKRFIATRKQGTHLCENLDYNGSVSEWQYIRPIRKGLEDEIRDKIYFELVTVIAKSEAERLASILTVDMLALFNNQPTQLK